MDIWLADLKYTGRNIGTDAIATLSDYLLRQFFSFLIIAPSARNRRAIAAYKKAGYRETGQYASSAPDYPDSITLVRHSSPALSE